MKEYIDREIALNEAFEPIETWITDDVVCVEDIKKIPTADVREVKHGHWMLLDECSNTGVYCSVCSKKVYKTDYANQKIKSKYCPNCGSIMDEEFEVL